VNEDSDVWTIGHSTRTADAFGQILRAHQIEILVDVRSFPGSRRYPQFNRESLSQFLTQMEIKYVHAPALGGRRDPRPDSHNTAWKNASFRAYADHMETDQFKKGFSDLVELASKGRTVIMCAEALWWRCHRSLVADYLKSNGLIVTHIFDDKKTELHPYTPAARIVNGELSYRGMLDSEG
jgi:uncharacterized protein (DUF488 family)